MIVDTQDGMCEITKEYFDGLFEGSHGQYALVSDLINARITDGDNALLLAPFVEEEFRLALFCMHSDKAPGPDRPIQPFISVSGISVAGRSTKLVVVGLRKESCLQVLMKQI